MLDTGSVMTTFPENVHCNGEWTTIDGGQVTHRVVGMMCLSKGILFNNIRCVDVEICLEKYVKQWFIHFLAIPLAAPLARNCTCWEPLQLQFCSDESSCGAKMTADLSPDGCIARIPCEKGRRLHIEGTNQVGAAGHRLGFTHTVGMHPQ